jgi:hypothetical protein
LFHRCIQALEKVLIDDDWRRPRQDSQPIWIRRQRTSSLISEGAGLVVDDADDHRVEASASEAVVMKLEQRGERQRQLPVSPNPAMMHLEEDALSVFTIGETIRSSR